MLHCVTTFSSPLLREIHSRVWYFVRTLARSRRCIGARAEVSLGEFSAVGVGVETGFRKTRKVVEARATAARGDTRR